MYNEPLERMYARVIFLGMMLGIDFEEIEEENNAEQIQDSPELLPAPSVEQEDGSGRGDTPVDNEGTVRGDYGGEVS